MYITVKGMVRQSIQRIKAMLLCIEYGILFVNTVDTKIKACNALHAVFVRVMRCENSTLYTVASNTNVDTQGISISNTFNATTTHF